VGVPRPSSQQIIEGLTYWLEGGEEPGLRVVLAPDM